MLKHPIFWILSALSVVCGLILWGTTVYSGSILPSTQGASPDERRSIWVLWSVIVAIPSITVLWLLVGLIIRRR